MAYSEEERRILHRLGYYHYQQGLVFRHLNQESGWESHLENCRNFILKSVDIFRPSRVTILGSGWLLDIPLRELLDRTVSVFLLDIVHPPETLRKASDLKNVRFVESDVTGGLAREVFNRAGRLPFWKKLKTISGVLIPEFSFADDPGLVISLNLLSQLHVLPEKFLKSRSTASEDEFTKFRQEVQEKHIGLLKKHKSVLITDVCEVFTDRKGEKSSVRTVEASIPEGSISGRWTWDFDLKRSDYYEKKSVLEVLATII